ncbi:RHS repeat-associated core domain-containing protein [Celerinatantimonas sp. YJH-8]|uniref:RHS repeat-associated core domain-containing protein n=1 Tax=Celerinatantimonas sp. YJH-8 TaxID=3228714 RepID=UPI0038C40577
MQRTLFGYDSELNLNAKAQTTDNIISLADERLKVHKTEYDRAGRVLKLRNNQYQYDECGRLIEKTAAQKGFRPQQTRYQWNADDQLVQVDLPNGERWRYQYDPFSRRISKTCTVSGQEQAQRYQWDGDLLIQSQQVVNGEVQRQTEYAYEPGSFRPVAQITQQNEQSRLHYIVTDITGSARELVNEQGQIVWRGYQEVWGDAHQQPINLDPKYAANDSIHDLIECDLRYPGQIFDKETGLYYNRHRYYDAYTGQYLSSDPIGMAGGLRPQAYVHNPVDWADPLGLSKYIGVDFTGTDALYQNGINTVKIKMTGGRYGDFKAANKLAGYKGPSGNATGKSHPDGYTWHHLNDYDPATNESTMQLVKTESHEATFPHAGSVSQFEKYHGVEYESKEAKGIASEINGPKPSKSCG